MFINFTNHPSKKWSRAQSDAANVYGEIFDISFPMVNPHGDEEYLLNLAENCAAEILSKKPNAVLCQGEMTLAFAVANILISNDVTVLAASSERVVTESRSFDGTNVKSAEFHFIKFRKYF